MNKAKRDRLVEELEAAILALKSMPVTTPCVDCIHMAGSFCTHWNAEVPPEAQAAGCHHWEESIPF